MKKYIVIAFFFLFTTAAGQDKGDVPYIDGIILPGPVEISIDVKIKKKQLKFYVFSGESLDGKSKPTFITDKQDLYEQIRDRLAVTDSSQSFCAYVRGMMLSQYSKIAPNILQGLGEYNRKRGLVLNEYNVYYISNIFGFDQFPPGEEAAPKKQELKKEKLSPPTKKSLRRDKEY